MKTAKKPQHWPHVPKSQQREGLRFIIKKVNHTLLRLVIDKACKRGWASRSHKEWMLRQIKKEMRDE